MSKIAIITYHKAENYGSALQAYALNKYLRGKGHNVKTIDYFKPEQTQLYNIFEPINSPISIARNLFSLFQLKNLKKHKQLFNNFIQDNIPLTENIIDRESLCKLNSNFDVFICGSDQIWNPNCADFDESYLLDFVFDKKKCIAYAPSIALKKLPTKWLHDYPNLISNFSAISVREGNISSELSSILHRDVQVVLDPVFLLSEEQWCSFKTRTSDKGYILCYFIGHVKGMRKFAKRIRRETGFKLIVITINLRDLLYCSTKRYAIGPKEFISLVSGAEYICTNSFHAVAFSLIFRKNFWAFADINSKSASSRLENILSKIGLSERLLTFNSMDQIQDTKQTINYTTEMSSVISQMRSSSAQFLTNAITKITTSVM